MNMTVQSKKLGQVISKSWSDCTFRKSLLADPMATLKAEGVNIPDGLEIRATENTDQVFHLVLPQQPNPKLTDKDIETAAMKPFGDGVWRSRAAGDFLCECCGRDRGNE